MPGEELPRDGEHAALLLAPRFGTAARMLAHLTPLEAPIVWLAFALGAAAGALTTWFVLGRRAARRS